MLRLSRLVDLRLGPTVVRMGQRPILMGIVNVTPDSFSDGGQFLDPARAIDRAVQLVEQGADWLDIGGESTRPGAEPVGLEEELRRVMPVVEGLAGKVTVPLSIDTYKAEVARQAVAAGATIINDISGFRDPAMIQVAAACDAACVCMHTIGEPRTMQELAHYNDVVGELFHYFEERLAAMTAGGIDPARIILDPGIGFAKKRRHNLDILRGLGEFQSLGRPLLLGVSRKRIVGELTGQSEENRLYGTIGAVIAGYLVGAQILRVHDVGPVREALSVVQAIAGEQQFDEKGKIIAP